MRVSKNFLFVASLALSALNLNAAGAPMEITPITSTSMIPLMAIEGVGDGMGQQNAPTPSTIMASATVPTASMCGSGQASANSSSLIDLRGSSTAPANTLYKCQLLTDGITYAIVPPFAVQSFYNAAGSVTGGKCWYGQVTSVASGAASVNYSSAGFSSPPFIQVQPVAASSTAGTNQQFWVNPVAGYTATSANLVVTTPATLTIVGLTIQLANAGVAINVLACGN